MRGIPESQPAVQQKTIHMINQSSQISQANAYMWLWTPNIMMEQQVVGEGKKSHSFHCRVSIPPVGAVLAKQTARLQP